MKIVCIIQARLGSSRFPNKIMKEINGQKIIEIIYRRLKKSKLIDKIIVAIPNTKKDDELNDFLINKKISVFRGSEKNVLERYFQAAKKHKAKIIIRITSDCPLISSDIIDEHLKVYKSKKFRVLNNYQSKTYPLGISFSICDFRSLEIANKKAKSKFDREHVMPFIYREMRSDTIKTKFYKNYNFLRLTIDYPVDLVTIRNIYNYFYPNIFFNFKKVINLYKKKPSLFKNNSKALFKIYPRI